MTAIGPDVDRRRAQCSGMADSKDEAAALVERAWMACRITG